jgi:hypothetical protein
VKSFFGSAGVQAHEVMGERGNTRGYALLNDQDVQQQVLDGACGRYGYRRNEVELRLYVGKFAGVPNRVCTNRPFASGVRSRLLAAGRFRSSMPEMWL